MGREARSHQWGKEGLTLAECLGQQSPGLSQTTPTSQIWGFYSAGGCRYRTVGSTEPEQLSHDTMTLPLNQNSWVDGLMG